MLVTSFMMSIFSLTILFSIRHSMRISKGLNFEEKIFYQIILATQVLVILELFSKVSGDHYIFGPFLFISGTFFLHAFNPIISIHWFLYIHYHIHSSKKTFKKIYIYGLAIMFINLVIILLNLKYGFIYHIDDYYHYHRGTYYMFTPAVNTIILVGSIILVICNKKRMSMSQMRTFILVSMIPIIAFILQNYYEEFPSAVYSVVLAVTIKYIMLQHKKVNHDFLTGLFNRRQLDYYIEDRIAYVKKYNDSFTVILVDVDDFKKINDVYGHATGDEALKNTANIIKSVIHKHDFAARFGGDEFYIISESKTEAEINELISKLELSFDKFNELSRRYRLSISIGYSIFDQSNIDSLISIQEKVDLSMYEKKLNKKRF